MSAHVARQTVAALAHELNQPLSAVANYTEAALRLLHGGRPSLDRLQHALENSTLQAQRAGRVVRDLLALLQKGDIETEAVDLNSVVRNALALVKADGHGDFRAVLELAPELSPVRANRLQVEKVLVNLVQNGIEAMRDAGVDSRLITITVRTASDARMAHVTVRDSGPGLDEPTLQRIFDPFFTTKATGLGMGLPISRAIVEAHGGRLWVEPIPGTGISVHFTLPFSQ
jgi:C4-dicarboxylate-specific signal transduction histidine kinase